MAGRRRFGWVRKLPSGRFQASYLDPQGERRYAEDTFRFKRDADLWLSEMQTDLRRGEWFDPERQKVTVGEFAARWIEERSGLRPRTADLYRSLLRNHIAPFIGGATLGEVDPAAVRRWRSERLEAGVSATTTAKAYRLLRAVLMTATDDGIISRNPCRIRGAGSEPTAERPVLSVEQVLALAARMPNDRLSLLVLVTTFGSLRWGEVTALRRMDVDLATGTLHIRTAMSRRYSGKVERGAPKSRASVRQVALPRPVLELLAVHLLDGVAEGDEALVFAGDRGGVMHRNNFNKRVHWPEAVAEIGAAGLHFHDLRHTGNMLAAMTGASLRALMDRMGHDSVRAALIYLHRAKGADRKIAEGLERLLDPGQGDPSGQSSHGSDDPQEDPSAGFPGAH